MPSHRKHKLILGATVLLILAGAASALAAHPKSGAKFSGTTSTKVDGYGAPVSFTVSSDGKKLTAFRYDTFGCFGSGGPVKGDPWKNSGSDVESVGTISLSTTGSFSVKNVKHSYTQQGYTTITTSSVSGSFRSATHASGTISYSQKVSRSGKPGSHGCGPAALTFTATAK